MEKNKHKPPSRIRYEKTHPVISFRTKSEWNEEFKAFLTEQNLSIGDFFRIAFEKQEIESRKSFDRGYLVGFGKFELPCNRCGRMMILDSNISEIKEKIEDIFKNYIHSKCPK